MSEVRKEVDKAEIERLGLAIRLAEARAALIHFDLEALDAARKVADK